MATKYNNWFTINAMGMSKAEKMMVAKARAHGDTSTTFCGTRYGNVMDSRGSVIPFCDPILHQPDPIRAPITVTDPNMTVMSSFAKDIASKFSWDVCATKTVAELIKAIKNRQIKNVK